MLPPLLQRLSGSQRILLVGAGGGYDIYCGLPLYHYLENQGKQVFLASLNFGVPDTTWGREVSKGLFEIASPANPPPKIGAETCLAMWFASRGKDVSLYCFKAGGVLEILAHYESLISLLNLDAIVLVDGGTDSLMRGDEPGLGSPGEDVASLGAAHLLKLPTRLIACLGFGLDAHHHVCHAYVLEAAAELTASGDFLGMFSLLAGMPELEFLADCVSFTAHRKETRPSIIAGSVVAAAQGKFGNHHTSSRTSGSKMFVNPLMSTYWSFEVDGLARRCLYLEPLLRTRNRGEITRVIQDFRSRITPRPWVELPF